MTGGSHIEMFVKLTCSARLRHKLSKLQLRAPWYLKGPKRMKKGKKKKERNEKLKSENLMLIMITFQIQNFHCIGIPNLEYNHPTRTLPPNPNSTFIRINNL